MVFRKVDEKTLGSETQNSLAGRLVEWCPTMDLLAFVTRDNNIAIHRLTWAKLHTFTENTSKVTSLAWSPDGKALASGHEDGKITIYDIEVGEQTACVPAHSAPVTALSWVMWGGANAENAEMMEDRTNQFIPPLIPLPENSSSVRTSVRLADAKRPSVLTVLFSGDATGVVAMRGLGTFCIGLCQTCITSSSGNTRAQVQSQGAAANRLATPSHAHSNS
jgi:WD40 repeat protein